MKLEKGMLIKTNYSGPYRIKSVTRECTCPSYTDELNMSNPPSGPPHIHIVCSRPDGTGEFYLNRWVESMLLSLGKSYCGESDRIELLESDRPVQMSLF